MQNTAMKPIDSQTFFVIAMTAGIPEDYFKHEKEHPGCYQGSLWHDKDIQTERAKGRKIKK
ncbi:MAG: hypothetical protein GX561_10635 [Lentisphaerae bacterium]|jgi:hypothetical protein|nr:hypothetical protein [Lentisphaerota bacterium]